MAAPTSGSGLTYCDVLRMPETNQFIELIDGELVVSPSPEPAHQRTVVHLTIELGLFARSHGHVLLTGPMDVLVEPRTVVQPDLLLIRAERRPPQFTRPITIPPDLAIEVLSPSNRSHDLVRKRAIYQRFGVRELWFVDLDEGWVEQVLLGAGSFGPARVHRTGDVVNAVQVPGFAADVAGILAG